MGSLAGKRDPPQKKIEDRGDGGDRMAGQDVPEDASGQEWCDGLMAGIGSLSEAIREADAGGGAPWASIGTACEDLSGEGLGADEGDPSGVDVWEDDAPDVLAVRNHPGLRDAYHILHEVGRGAQGRMYMAMARHSGRIVAIKALSLRAMSDWKSTELFRREIAVLQSMRVPGTPQYIEAIDASRDPEPYYFLVQGYIPGASLEVMLDKGVVFLAEEVVAVALSIISILEQLKQYVPPIVHRDIKPSNIMLTPQGKIFLVDFGAAMLNERRMGGSTFAGTAGYMAPEQCMGNSGPESDIYGLGATLIHLLSGVPPYKLPLRSMRLQFRSAIPKTTPIWLIQLIEAMVSPMPNERVTDLDKIVRAMRNSGGFERQGQMIRPRVPADLLKAKSKSPANEADAEQAPLAVPLPETLKLVPGYGYFVDRSMFYSWGVAFVVLIILMNTFGVASARVVVFVMLSLIPVSLALMRSHMSSVFMRRALKNRPLNSRETQNRQDGE